MYQAPVGTKDAELVAACLGIGHGTSGVLGFALAHNVAAVMSAHNHSSGVLELSRSEVQMTTESSSYWGVLEIAVLDHVVVG